MLPVESHTAAGPSTRLQPELQNANNRLAGDLAGRVRIWQRGVWLHRPRSNTLWQFSTEVMHNDIHSG